VDVADPRYEPTSTTVTVEVGALQDVTMVTSARGTGAGRRRGPLVAAAAFLVLAVGAIIPQPWGVTLDPSELEARAADVSTARLTGGGVEGRISRGALPAVPFRAAVPADGLLTAVESLRAAGAKVDASWEVNRLIVQAAEAQSQMRYFGSAGDDVRAYAQRAAAFDSGSAEARSLLRKVAERMAWDAEAAIADGAVDAGRELAAECLSLVPEHLRCLAVSGG
jgi:hypothetical protein